MLAALENAVLVGLGLTFAISNGILAHIEAFPAPSPYLMKRFSRAIWALRPATDSTKGGQRRSAALRTRLSSYLLEANRKRQQK